MALSIARKSTKETVMDKIRAASEELGEPLPTTKMNPKTGRPVRKSAGRKVAHPDFLDSAKVIDDDASDKGGDEDYDHEENARSKKKPKSKKRKRTPSPEPSRLSPEPYHDIRLPESSPAPEDRLTNSRPTPTSGTVNIVANIPLGFCGPLHITLDISDFLGAQKRRCTLGVGGLGVDFGLARGILSKPAQSSKCGFLTLPAEIRNQIYRLLFVSPQPLDLRGDHLCRSGALLSTCRQVYDESRDILYGENSFVVDRDKSSRRHMWQRDSKEVGYKHFHMWLSNMSPSTRTMIRHLDLELDDALPSHTPELKNNEERRYVHDGHLIEALKLLGHDGQIQEMKLTFLGRRSLARTDHRFLKYLCRIKVDDLAKKELVSRYMYPYNRVSDDVMGHIRREMTRKIKLFATEEV